MELKLGLGLRLWMARTECSGNGFAIRMDLFDAEDGEHEAGVVFGGAVDGFVAFWHGDGVWFIFLFVFFVWVLFLRFSFWWIVDEGCEWVGVSELLLLLWIWIWI